MREPHRVANLSEIVESSIHALSTELDIVTRLILVLQGVGMLGVAQEKLEPRLESGGKLGRLGNERGIRGTTVENR